MSRRTVKKTRELTYEERKQAAWERHHSTSHLDAAHIPPVTAGRELSVGTSVEVGNLYDCVVAEVSEDGRFALIDHTRIDNNYGNPVRHEHQLAVWDWISCLPLAGVEDTRLAPKGLPRPAHMNTELAGLLRSTMHRGLIDNPDYQRSYVWTQADKENLIESVFHRREIGKFLFVDRSGSKEYRLEVLDGKQRLDALFGFYLSRFAWRGKFYHQLSRRDRYRFDSLTVQFAHLDGSSLSRADILRVFLNVNAAGVPQTEEHLAHVRKLLEAEKEHEHD